MTWFSARALSHGKCVPLYSIILVAFDLEEAASQGSLVWVQDWLVPKLLRPTGASFQGAIILDSILHFNDTINSQNIASGWKKLVPDAVNEIEKNKSGYLTDLSYGKKHFKKPCILR